jgi:hypothetical protein
VYSMSCFFSKPPYEHYLYAMGYEAAIASGHDLDSTTRRWSMMWNLDDMPEAELFETAEVLEHLARYARTRVQAMRFRAAGVEGRARHLERECERIYAQLPVWAQWAP